MPQATSTPPGMVHVPAGEFLMGCTTDEVQPDPSYPDMDYLASARPQRRVWLPDYFIDVYPVTNRQYKQFTDETGYDVPMPQEDLPPVLLQYGWDRASRSYPQGKDGNPVVMVTYYDALAYCEWAGKRLPSEAEWEKAARGDDGRPFPWGWERDFEHRCNCYSTISSPVERTPAATPPELSAVNAYPTGVSPYGCYDMLGNAREWCSNWYDVRYYARMRARHPVGPRRTRKRWRVARGCGGLHTGPHIAYRGAEYPWAKDSATGFRCASSIR
jgi:iron(II)-dependent oxidoreductase